MVIYCYSAVCHALAVPKSKRETFLAAPIHFTRSPIPISAHVHALRLHKRAAPAASAAQHVATPTISQFLNFHEENFRGRKSSYKIHESIVSRKFGAVQYFRT